MHSEEMTVSEVGHLLSKEFVTGLDKDCSVSPSKWWSFKALGFTIYCYNFKWRQKAIFRHDLHHLVTGYPFTLRGEMQVATWEFAAGRFQNILANLFCLPLVAVGCLLIPRKIWKAYCEGKNNKSLFHMNLPSQLSELSLKELRQLTRNPQLVPINWQVKLEFFFLNLLSFLEIALLIIAPGFVLYQLLMILDFL